MDEWEVHAEVAVATGMAAQQEGVARLTRDTEQLRRESRGVIRQARASLDALMAAGVIPEMPE